MPGLRWFLVPRANLTRHYGAFMRFMSFGFNSRQCEQVMPDKRSRDILSNSIAEPEADIERRATIIHRLVTCNWKRCNIPISRGGRFCTAEYIQGDCSIIRIYPAWERTLSNTTFHPTSWLAGDSGLPCAHYSRYVDADSQCASACAWKRLPLAGGNYLRYFYQTTGNRCPGFR